MALTTTASAGCAANQVNTAGAGRARKSSDSTLVSSSVFINAADSVCRASSWRF